MKFFAFIGVVFSESVYINIKNSKKMTPMVKISIPPTKENDAYEFNLELGSQF